MLKWTKAPLVNTFTQNNIKINLFYIFFLLNIVRIKFILYDFGLFNNS